MTTEVERTFPRLTQPLIAHGQLTAERIAQPHPGTFDLPERIVQFGTGAFLRGFVDFFIDEAIHTGAYAGRVVAIGSTGSGRDAALNEQDGLYTLIVEGGTSRGAHRECRVIGAVSRALSAATEWQAILALARQPELELVFSNTTEIGINIDAGDVLDAAPPPSFPGKLTRFLVERGRAFDFADSAGLVILPCELIERNGEKLRELVLALARRWDVGAAFTEWIDRAVRFCNTLVDRIVPGAPNDLRRSSLEAELGYRDDMMIVAEPYRLFAIEADAATRARLRFASVDKGIVLTEDIRPYRERKVRILNGGHTLMAPIALLIGCETVLDAMRHPLVAPYLRQLLFTEIVPSLDVPERERFAEEVLMRFANPSLRHALRDITVQQTAKMRVRVVPSVVSFSERSGHVPALLAFGFAAYLALLRASVGAGTEHPVTLGTDADGERICTLWRAATDESDATLRRVAGQVCADTELWHADLASVPGFVDLVAEDLVHITRRGVAAALATHVGDRAEFTEAAPVLSTKS